MQPDDQPYCGEELLPHATAPDGTPAPIPRTHPPHPSSAPILCTHPLHPSRPQPVCHAPERRTHDPLAVAGRRRELAQPPRHRLPRVTEPEPGYCIACGGYHLTTKVPEWGGPACANCKATRRLDPPEPGPRHICNTSTRHKPGQPEYRRCSCGLWYHSGGGYWYRVPHPPARWLRENGLNPGEFWTMEDDEHGPRLFDDLHARRPTLLMLLRYLFRG